ncbi:hypothetical protein Y032_0343g3050 [Ancylostoma ceylanicum]|uniref:Uncharacterized protein n=1 Tax=Ancylostoma ceylanicum TaxID=53326 RepID=A0A016RXL5_9BILA|nr:hypothetical protein Y032_0343g3050 [Ancylostoma ceylanicum]
MKPLTIFLETSKKGYASPVEKVANNLCLDDRIKLLDNDLLVKGCLQVELGRPPVVPLRPRPSSGPQASRWSRQQAAAGRDNPPSSHRSSTHPHTRTVTQRWLAVFAVGFPSNDTFSRPIKRPFVAASGRFHDEKAHHQH